MSLPRSSKPFGFRLIFFQLSLLALRSWGRIWFVLNNAKPYRDLSMAPPLAVYIFVNLISGLLFALTAIGFWQRQIWALRYSWLILGGSGVFEWAWLAIFAQTSYDRGRLPFLLVVIIMVLCFDYLLLNRPQFHAKTFGDDFS